MTKQKRIKVPGTKTRVLALKSLRDARVVAHGPALAGVLAKARKAGAEDPVVIYVPEAGRRYIF